MEPIDRIINAYYSFITFLRASLDFLFLTFGRSLDRRKHRFKGILLLPLNNAVNIIQNINDFSLYFFSVLLLHVQRVQLIVVHLL